MRIDQLNLAERRLPSGVEALTIASPTPRGKNQPSGSPKNMASEPFQSVLSRRQGLFLDATARGNNGLDLSPTERARKGAEDFVAAAFIEPLLKQLRETNHAAAPFAPGPAEKQFGGILDAQVSRQIAHASRYALVDEIARRMGQGKLAGGAPPSMIPTAPSAAEQIGTAAKAKGGLNVTAF